MNIHNNTMRLSKSFTGLFFHAKESDSLAIPKRVIKGDRENFSSVLHH